MVTKIFSTSMMYRRTASANYPRWRWTHPRFPLDGAFITRIYTAEVRGYEETESNDKKNDTMNHCENKESKGQNPALAFQNVIKELQEKIPQNYTTDQVVGTIKGDDKYQTESLNVGDKDKESKNEKTEKKKRSWIRNMLASLKFFHKNKGKKYDIKHKS